MAEVKNAFIKSKMNKDLDDRLLPSGEYRNAVNAQVSRSEGSDVGALENVLGNFLLQDFEVVTGVNDLSCIGFFADNASSIVYLFFTDYKDLEVTNPSYNPNSNNFIFSYNTISNSYSLLVEGSFLNFSKTNPIYGINLLENLLFWTDNRNQPRKINVDLANSTNAVSPTYYTTEDQISVAKYNPYKPIQMYAVSTATGVGVEEYETTMKDVVSIHFPNGGVGNVVSATSTNVVVDSFTGDIVLPSDNYDSGASVSYTNSDGDLVKVTGATVSAATYTDVTSSWSITITGGTFPSLTSSQKIVLNANPYYDSSFSGDTNYLNDKFARFGYRFKFDDNEYSLLSTFTQTAFIPKQDGYFMYVKKDDLEEVDDESSSYRSTIVSFVENKVNDIKLRIPLPFYNYEIRNKLKIEAIDIIYKESDGLDVKVIDSLPINKIENSSGVANTSSSVSSSLEIPVDGLKGGVKVGNTVQGEGITGSPVVVSFEYITGSTTSGTITLDVAQTLVDNASLTIGEPSFFVYDYKSEKPIKTLPSKEITRVYDKIPVRALAQEVISNRVVYGNYQDKHTPPSSIDYNVLVSEKSDINMNNGSANVSVVNSSNSATITGLTGSLSVGSRAKSDNIPEDTFVTNISGSLLTFSKDTTLAVSDVISFEPQSNIQNTTSSVSYPSSSLKANRTYQLGLVLSDRYGRQSTTILSNNNDTINFNNKVYSGSTIFSDYIDKSVNPVDWIGSSIKLLFNSAIDSSKNFNTGRPGIYNGESTSSDYNPLGWYSFKVVVKQTEQEYYNVYLPGIMASYPDNTTLEVGNTSHMVLINDNINKIPRDLSEIGPDQKLYRSSVEIYGRVQNSSQAITSTNPGEGNIQYFPGSRNDIVNSIATVRDLFNYKVEETPQPDLFPQFYSIESNPLIARISTSSKIGQLANVNYATSSANVSIAGTTDNISLVNVVGDTANLQVGDFVQGPNFPSDLKVDTGGFVAGSAGPTTTASSGVTSDTIPITSATNVSAGQSVSGLNIPEGSFILELLESPWRIKINNVASVTSGTTLTMTNPSTLNVTSSVSVNYGDDIRVYSSSSPGVQQLAVYETKPVESLLDIFWETSTTGLIQDVNNAVLNSTSSGGGGASGINSYNSSPFTESLWPSGFPVVYPRIFTDTIYLVDSFGLAVTVGAGDTPLYITSVENGNNINVSNYFILTETSPGSYEYDINITNDYTDDVYYGSDPNLRTFTFNFQANINNQPIAFSETISLVNEPPYILAPSEFSPTSTPIQVEDKRTTDQSIIDLGGANGSGPTVPNFFIPATNTGADLQWELVTQENSQGNDVTYFSINTSTGLITNNGYQNQNMPSDKYKLDIKLSDPSLFVNRDVYVNMGLIVEDIEQRTITGTANGSPYTATFLLLKVPLQPGQIYDPNNGYYAYTLGKQSASGPWATLISNTGGNVIQIPGGGSTGTGCVDWDFTIGSRSDMENSIYSSQCVPTLTNYSWSDGPLLNPDPIGYTFEFV